MIYHAQGKCPRYFLCAKICPLTKIGGAIQEAEPRLARVLSILFQSQIDGSNDVEGWEPVQNARRRIGPNSCARL